MIVDLMFQVKTPLIPNFKSFLIFGFILGVEKQKALKNNQKNKKNTKTIPITHGQNCNVVRNTLLFSYL